MIPKEFKNTHNRIKRFEEFKNKLIQEENYNEFKDEIEEMNNEVELYGEKYSVASQEFYEKNSKSLSGVELIIEQGKLEGLSYDEIHVEARNYEIDVEFNSMVKSKTYFEGCPLDIYDKHYDQNMIEYVNELMDRSEIDFIISETNRVVNFNYYGGSEIMERIKVSNKRIIEFLTNKSLELNYKIYIDDGIYFYEEIPHEYSGNENELKSIDKIRLLIELGIIDFLKTRGLDIYSPSSHAIAKVVSKWTSEDPATLSRYINAYITDNKKDKNYPLKNPIKSLGLIHEIIKNSNLKRKDED